MSSKVVKFESGYLIINNNEATGEIFFDFAKLPQEVSK